MALPIFALLQGGAAAAQGIAGLFQGIKARKLAKQNIRPTYQIPDEIKANLRLAKTRANQGLDPAAYGNALNNIWRNRNASVASLQDRRSALAGIGTANALSNDATLKLDIADAAAKRDNERMLMAQNQTMAGYKDKSWDWNERQRFEENADAIRALRGASQRNVMGALNNIGGAAATAAYGGLFDKMPQGAGAFKPASTVGGVDINSMLGGRRMVFNPQTQQYEIK